MSRAPRETPADAATAADAAAPVPHPRARRDWRADLAAAGLPADLAAVVSLVVRRSRLWRSEKADLARELAAHFADGLTAGRSPKELLMDFGDPRAASALVRRAKRRSRHWAARAFILTAQGLGALLMAAIVAYAVLAWRYFGGEPAVTRDYVAEHNERVEQIPASERAYDLYIEAWTRMPRRPDSVAYAWPAVAPEHPAYPDAVAYLEQAAPAIALLHQAAARPHYGAPLSDAIDPRLVEHFRGRDWLFEDAPREPSVSPPLISIMLPALGEFRESARLLSFDAHIAARAGDAARAERDLATLLGMAEHAAQQPTLISQLVGIAIHALATRTASELLHYHPDLLSEEQLQSLAHRVSGFMSGRPRVDLTGEKHNFYDTVQRVYSDDGNGNGYITAEGLHNLVSQFDPKMPRVPAFASPLGPLAVAVVADRASMTAKFEELFDRLERDAELPLWRFDEQSDTRHVIEAMEADPITRMRYLPIAILMPALSQAVASIETTIQFRDALLTGIALELYRRDHGAYPDALDKLAPAYLPAVPPDRFTGQPLRYAVADGSARLWSVGADRDDDGGRAPENESNLVYQWIPATEIPERLADPAARASFDGDWVLWPAEYRPVTSDPDNLRSPTGVVPGPTR